ncbi:MAG: TlpA family protein disulfide reductase [Sulfurospirillum sp.]|nr:TlpA family protein disulfide reductase [Sulfurospirillum sp.]
MSLFFVACSQEVKTQPKKSFTVGEEIHLKSVMGSEATLIRKEQGFVLKGNEDKIIMFDIFGTFCQPCKEEAAHLMDLQIKNADDVMLIGLDHLEEVSDAYIVDNFSGKYNAYYFITNSSQNEQIVATILDDINYKPILQIPFKVVLKNGAYQLLTDIYEKNPANNFYLGKVPIPVMQTDLDVIKKK